MVQANRDHMSERAGRAPVAVILVVGEPRRDIRVQKHALSLHELGLTVTTIAVLNETAHPLDELTQFGRVLRIVPASGGPTIAAVSKAAPSEGGGHRESRAPHGVKTRVMGFLRARLPQLRDVDVLRAMFRMNREMARVASALAPTLVIACDLNTLRAGTMLARRGSSLVYDAHEVFAESDPSLSRFLRRLLTATEWLLIRRPSLVTTVSEPIAASLQKRYRIPMPAVIENAPLSRSDGPSPVHTPVRVLYQGAFTADRNLLGLVMSIEPLRRTVILSMQGFGPLEAELRRVVQDNMLADCVEFLPPCEPLDTVASATNHDIGVIALDTSSLNNRLSAPNKLHDYMAAGLAIVAARMPYLASVLERERCGITYDPNDPDALAAAISTLAAEPERLTALKLASWEASERHLWTAVYAPLRAFVRSISQP